MISHVSRYILSQHPDIEAKVLAELDELELLATPQRPSPRNLTSADLSKLVYLNCVIKVLHIQRCTSS